MKLLRDHWAIDLARGRGLDLVRVALGAVFVWFGALKLIGGSPVEDLVAATLHWLPRPIAVRGLGALEVLVGLGLVTLVAARITFLLFFVQMLGTFSVLVLHPSLAFQGRNPLMLTTLGEFVVKNLVLLTAGIAIAGHVIAKARASDRISEVLLGRGSAPNVRREATLEQQDPRG